MSIFSLGITVGSKLVAAKVLGIKENPPKTMDAAANESVALMFSPLDLNGDMEVWLALAFAAKLSRTREGLEVLNNLLGKYLDNIAHICNALSNASAANWLTALNNEFLAVSMCRRLGLISAGEAVFIHGHLTSVFNQMLVKGYVESTIGSLTSLVNNTSLGAGGGSGGLAALAKLLPAVGV